MARVKTSAEGYAPDALDCCSMLNELGVKFGLICRITVQYTVSRVTVVVQAGTGRAFGEFDVIYVAKNERNTSDKRTRDAQVWQALWDIYTQADTGIAGCAPRPVYKK